MRPAHPVPFWVSKIPILGLLSPTPTISGFKHPNFLLATPKCRFLYIADAQAASLEPNWDPAKMAAIHLESCTDLSILLRIHAQMLRNQWLRAPFHWNSLMRSYLRLSLPRAALRLYVQMSRAGAHPDSYTFPIAFKAACHLFAHDLASQLHSVALKYCLDGHEFCESGLISAYTKSGEFVSARQVFDENPARQLGSWNALINGLAQAGLSHEAIDTFIELRRSGSVPDDVTMVSVASACGSLGDLWLAQQVHVCALRAGRTGRLDVMLANALLDMYAKCGRTDLAHRVFARMPARDVSSWTSMIAGLAAHGQESSALKLFRRMVREGVAPNHVTLVGVLSACAHGGLVDEGMAYFKSMRGRYGVEPTMAHYGCVVDMLGRVGRLREARAVVEGMPMGANAVIYGTLLGASEKHRDVEIGEWVAGKLIELGPWNDGVYVVLSNIYAAASMWEGVERLRTWMRDKSVAKTPGYSLATMCS